MNTDHYSRKRRHLGYLARKLEFFLKQPEGNQSRIEQLIFKIKLLIKELKAVFSKRDLKRVLGATAIFFGITVSGQLNAQSFGPPQVNPFKLDSTYYYSMPAFADLDNDGDMDLLVGEYYGFLTYFENTGSATNPSFAPGQENPFGLVPSADLAFPTFADLDGDGDQDLLVGEYYGAMKYYQNTGNETTPQFATPVINPFGLNSVAVAAIPDFVDLDGDGDMDLIVGEYYGNLQYFENTGSNTNPQFAAPVQNPFGLIATGLAIPEFADLDGDGDLDLLSGVYDGDMAYFENTGSNTSPQFGNPVLNPFGLVPTYTFAYPAFTDLDGDGDIDLMVGEYYGALQYYENTSPVGISQFTTDAELTLYPNPATDVVRIKSKLEIIQIDIIDLQGKMVYSDKTSAGLIDVSRLNRGIYFVKITSKDGKVLSKRLMKR